MPPLHSIQRVLVSAAIGLLMSLSALAGPASFSQARSVPRAMTVQEIPREARGTLAYVRDHGEAPPGQVGGRRFGNYGRGGEQKLPQQDTLGRPIEYREWDIHPKVPGRNRGAERLVTGSDGRAWYTADHYSTFTEIQ